MSKSEEPLLDFEKICRLCLLEKRSMSSIFAKKKSDKKVPLAVRIMSCAALELYEGDGLPASICSKCLLSVNQSYAFKEQCEQADTTLRQYAQRMNEARGVTSSKLYDSVEGSLEETVVEAEEVEDAKVKREKSLEEEVELKPSLDEAEEKPIADEAEEKPVADEAEEKANMDDVEIEYLEEDYLKEMDDEENMEGEDQIYLKSDLGEATAVVLPEGIKLEEKWEIDGENFTFMLVGSEVETGVIVQEVEENVFEEKDNESEVIIICDFCEKPVRKSSFEEHVKLIHALKYCKLCKTEVKEKFFNAHMKAHEDSRIFCEACSKLVKKEDFIKHCKKHQGHESADKREKVNRKVCDICGYQVEGKGTLNKHMREKHDEGQNYCDLCEKYVWLKCFDKHMKDVHEDHENFCNKCQKTFKYYKTHMRTSHKDIIKFCDYCQVDVESNNFCFHVATIHSKQSHFCETCNKEFFEFVCYKNHVRNIHLKVKSYKCSECDFTTAYRTSMDKHILGTHTRNQKYVCEICAKEFIVKDNLRKHIRMIHNGQQRSVCTYCGKICHANRELINHVRLHTGDLPYQCEFCLRKFPKKWTLDNHRRIHTGEKPYKCSHCDTAFGTSAQMKIHEFRAHGVEKYRHVDRAGKRRKLPWSGEDGVFGI